MLSAIPPTARRQQGIVLIVVLIMLVVIGLASAYTMRQSINADSIAQNVRSEALAQEAAQIALRFCERQATGQPATIKAAETGQATDGHWNNLAHWQGQGGDSAPTTLQAADVADATASFTPSTLPQCMAEYRTFGAGQQVVVVTARGFSPDYEQDAAGNTTRGSVVWLQSTLQVQAAGGGAQSPTPGS